MLMRGGYAQKGWGVDRVVHRRVLARAAILEGGAERLAVLLGVSSGLVARWIEGREPVPRDVFMRCVGYLLN
jgi:DNA-binding transcriptional regulator YdaS (Cro superfamily)